MNGLDVTYLSPLALSVFFGGLKILGRIRWSWFAVVMPVVIEASFLAGMVFALWLLAHVAPIL